MSIEIVGISVKSSPDGLYCLNDLHQASGGKAKDKPSNWLATPQAKDLMSEILIAGRLAIKKSPGRYGGTYICKEMVYAYAMWISAAFQLKVINAYEKNADIQSQLDSLVDQVRKKALSISSAVDKTTLALSEIKQHGSAWGAYGASIKKTKKYAVQELEAVKQEIQLKLDLLEK